MKISKHFSWIWVFFLSKVKFVLVLYKNNEKTKKIFIQQPNNFLILRVKKYC